MTAARVVLLAWGNPSRGDDALGPLLQERAEAWAEGCPGVPLVVLGDFQLQVEHALDLQSRDLVLFVDADASCPAPWVFEPVSAGGNPSCSSHALAPEEVLGTFERLAGGPAPPAFLLRVRGEAFGLGQPLSPAGSRHLESAWGFLRCLLEDPRPGAWVSRLGVPPCPSPTSSKR